MTSLIPYTSDYCVAFEKCVIDGQLLINAFEEYSQMAKRTALTKDCIEFCVKCLHAFESAILYWGKMILSCKDCCTSCANECDKYDHEICRKFAHSCRRRVEELQLVLA